jgi:hypothetical protein
MTTQSRGVRRDRSARRRVGRAARVVSFYFGAVWAYVAVVAVIRSSTLSDPLWHQLPGLRRDTAGALCFGGSLVFYAVAQFVDGRP